MAPATPRCSLAAMRTLPLRPAPRLRALPALFATILAPAIADAQSATTGAPLVAAADRIFAPWNNTHGPGCAVGVARGTTTLLERGYGMADLNGNRPIIASTILESGSVAKQFTAAAVMLLVADGKVALEDDARKYLPELPSYGHTMTVRHLLTHTSGLRDWGSLVAWQGWPRNSRAYTQTDLLLLLTSQRTINYPVGDHYSYTNAGFILARTLVERVSGMDFETFSRLRIFEPLGLTHTSWRGDYRRVVPGLGQAYRRTAGGWQIEMPNESIIGPGGLWTTVGDWLTWNQHLTRKTLGSAVVDSMTRQMRLTSGLEIAYALGLTVGQYRGTKEIGHSGSTAGYSTYLARYPELGDLSVAVMCNAAGAPAASYVHAIVDALHPTLPRPSIMDTVALDIAAVLPWRGHYEDTRWHSISVLDTAGGVLRLSGTPVRARRDGSYQVGGQHVRLAAGSHTTPRSIRTVTSDGDSVVHVWRAAERWQPTNAELATLAGRYRSDELDITFSVRVRDGKLVVSPRHGVDDVLTPTVKDAFDGGDNAVWFTRGKGGKVTAMHFGASRVWDLVSVRVP